MKKYEVCIEYDTDYDFMQCNESVMHLSPCLALLEVINFHNIPEDRIRFINIKPL